MSLYLLQCRRVSGTAPPCQIQTHHRKMHHPSPPPWLCRHHVFNAMALTKSPGSPSILTMTMEPLHEQSLNRSSLSFKSEEFSRTQFHLTPGDPFRTSSSLGDLSCHPKGTPMQRSLLPLCAVVQQHPSRRQVGEEWRWHPKRMNRPTMRTI